MEELELDKKAQNKKRAIFITRAILWFTFAAILPFAFIAWRYGIFQTDINLKLSGWGIIAVIILAVGIVTFGKYIYKGMKQCLFKQCIHGFVTIIIPLLALYLITMSIIKNVEIFQKALGCVIVCEFIAIPINPFPTWIAEKEMENQIQSTESSLELLTNKLFKRKKENETR